MKNDLASGNSVMPKHKEENQESNAFTEPSKVNKL